MNKNIFLLPAVLLTCSAKAQATHEGLNKVSRNHRIVVDSVIQTTNYTYLHGIENDTARWLAVPSMEANAGSTYYYIGGMPMTQFKSTELKRTFDLVLFLGGVSEEPITPDGLAHPHGDNAHGTGDKSYKHTPAAETKTTVHIAPGEGCLSIAQLIASKDSCAGKTVRVKGQVTKYNEGIMNKNWLHLQDGSDNNGKFDLVVTTNATAKVGDVVTLEGKVTLNKDFGYGYSFEVILQDAIVK